MTTSASFHCFSSTVLAAWFTLTLVQLPLLGCATYTSRWISENRLAIIDRPSARHLLQSPVTHVDLVEDLSGNSVFNLERRRREVLVQGDPVFRSRVGIPRKKGRKMLYGIRSCVSQDLTITQGPVASTSGIPTFLVQILNLCGACAMSQIRVACGNWASATPVDPFVFSRVGYNDCLVNNGGPLSSQGSVTFQYSNSAMYPMSIISANNDCGQT